MHECWSSFVEHLFSGISLHPNSYGEVMNCFCCNYL
jgi:hypothetical protein